MQNNEITEALDGAEIIAVPAENPQTAVARLALLTPLEYELVREMESKRLGITRLSVLDKQVEAERKAGNVVIGKAALFQPVTPWPEPVDANALLHEVAETIRRFIVCDREIKLAVTLWCAFTWIIEHVEVAPIAMITAPEKQCGKSQLLTLIGKLSNRPLVASSITAQSLFRVVEAFSPTLLIDEADSFMREDEDLRGIINSGHTRQSAFAIRCVGDNHEPTVFSTWGAKAISGIGYLPDTIMDRAIIFNLRRKLAGEEVQRLRHADKGLFETLTAKLARFAADAGGSIALARPEIPETLSDRAQDNWEPLLAVADYAGGEWPKLAREVAQKISGVEQSALSLSAELLADIREVFESKGVDRISSADLITALCADDEKSWATYNRGQPIKPRQLAKRLGEYDIKSKTVRIGYDTPKGFERAQFDDAFIRYLSPTPSVSATAQQISVSLTNPVADTLVCCATDLQSATAKPALTNDCCAVADILPTVASHTMVEVTL